MKFEPPQRDLDALETKEWLESFDALVAANGIERAHYILMALLKRAQIDQVALPALVQTPYLNTIPAELEPDYPGDEDFEKRIRRYIRWNSAVMVMKANHHFPGIGGHLSTYASAATLYEVGINHFFRGKDHPGGGDQIFYQGHSSPGMYARAFLEGRITEDQLLHFRREVKRGEGLSSYPHPWLMPDFWEFPTVSMGLGPISAIYQARFNRYLHNRGIKDTSDQRVWAFLGDGETDEPEALGALHLAASEKLSNLVFVVNCNLQRLDGPVRGNGKIIQELEARFNGAGWNVIKVVWGREWDSLVANDDRGLLVRRMGEVVDGEFQKYSVETGAYVREHFFGKSPELLRQVEHLSDDDIKHLRRGGHDFRKVYAAYKAATEETERPTVILAKTVKGWVLGDSAEGRNVAHQAKKMSVTELKLFRDRLFLDIPDRQLDDPPFIRFAEDGPAHQYMLERRRALGGFVPERRVTRVSVETPKMDYFAKYFEGTGDGDASTTGAFARVLAQLLTHPTLGRRIVPIIADEARTFGLDALFRRYGIYASQGQKYTPVDASLLLSYREAKDGQVLEEGICEAGAMASFVTAATSYATHGTPMLPVYLFYSMFGFQRTADQMWQAGDQRGRGFLIGATFGRTALNGEGLQHQDGHSLLLASTNPSVKSYEPAFAYEIAVIVQRGLEEMLTLEHDVIYYVTVHNETYRQPPIPGDVAKGILDGVYRYHASDVAGAKVQLLGSGALMNEVIRAQALLAEHWNVSADVWSATSYSELRRDALAAERYNRLHPMGPHRVPNVVTAFAGADGPFIAVSDNMAAVPDQISRWIPGGLHSLGTDGFGRSDTRQALRRHFEIDAEHIAVAALARLAALGTVTSGVVAEAIARYGIDPEAIDPAIA